MEKIKQQDIRNATAIKFKTVELDLMQKVTKAFIRQIEVSRNEAYTPDEIEVLKEFTRIRNY